MEDWSQQQKTWDRKESRKTKSRALSLNMHISSIRDHGVAGERKWPGNVRGHWQTGGANMLCLLINGARVSKYTWTPPSSSFSCLSTAWHGWMGGFFSLAFKKRLSHKNIVVHHENINNTFPSVMWVWFIHLPPCRLRRRRRSRESRDGRRSADTNSLGSVFSSSLCHKGHPGYSRCVWEQL